MKKKMFVLMSGVLIWISGNCFAEETNAGAILKSVAEKYKSIENYSAKGTVASEINDGANKTTIESSFSIKLKKPNLYLVSWQQKMPGANQSGTVWNSGSQPYLYMGITNSYSKMQSDEMALGAATGISGGASHTIPSLFKGTPIFSALKDVKLENNEKVNGEDCYVISGNLKGVGQETFWISHKSFFILMDRHVISPPTGNVPEMSDADLEKAIKASGQEVTKENMEIMRNALKQSKETMKKNTVTTTKKYTDIATTALTEKDFTFEVPKGTVLKENILATP